jgi:hypothetical protein
VSCGCICAMWEPHDLCGSHRVPLGSPVNSIGAVFCHMGGNWHCMEARWELWASDESHMVPFGGLMPYGNVFPHM